MLPIVRWTGSKRYQAETIVDRFPKEINTYYAPIGENYLINFEKGNYGILSFMHYNNFYEIFTKIKPINSDITIFNVKNIIFLILIIIFFINIQHLKNPHMKIFIIQIQKT
jgi:hypothetical protein